MIRPLSLLLCCIASASAAEPAADLLRFANGDQLHGQLAGIGEGGCLLWKRPDLDELARFQPANLRHAVLHQEPLAQDLTGISLVELINGDQIPGRIVAMDRSRISVESTCLGTLAIPMDKVARIAPQPVGGKIRYCGPFTPKGWEILSTNLAISDAAEPLPAPAVNPPAPANEVEKEPADGNKAEGWRQRGDSWYWLDGPSGTGLVRRNCLPEKSLLGFDLVWKNNMSLIIGLHADFCKLPPAGKEAKDANQGAQFMPGDSSSYPKAMGNAQVIQIHSNYILVSRSVVDANGNEASHRIHQVSSRFRFVENSKARFEFRSNSRDGNVSLFVNDQYITQWNQGSVEVDATKPLPPLGSGLVFYALSNDAKFKLSNMVIAEWNGMPDAARSMQSDEHDIMLMTNGMDRYSGKVSTLDDKGRLNFEGRHGSVSVPLAEVAEIQMARPQSRKPPQAPDKQMTAHLSPMGIVSGSPISGDNQSLTLQNDIIGPIKLNTDSAILLEFHADEATYDDWDANF